MNCFSRSCFFLAWLTLATLPPVVVRAETGSDMAANGQFRAAKQAINAGDLARARALLLELWSKEQTYDVAGQLGYVEYHLKNFGASARYTAFSLAHLPPHESRETQQRLRMAMDDLKPRVGTLHITVSEPGAEVRTGDLILGTSPLASDAYVDPGTYEIQARIAPERIATQPVTVAAGGVYDVQLTLPAASAPEPVGEVVQPAMSQPAAPLPATATPTPQERPTQDKPGSKSLVPVYIGAAVTAIGVGMWVGFGVSAKNGRDEVNALQQHLDDNQITCVNGSAAPECGQLNDAVERQHRDATFAKVGIGITAVGGVATLAYVLFWPSHKTEDTATARANFNIRPDLTFGQHGSSVSVKGEF